MSYDDWRARWLLDPENRRAWRRYKIVTFIPDMLFRLKMWVRQMLDKHGK